MHDIREWPGCHGILMISVSDTAVASVSLYSGWPARSFHRTSIAHPSPVSGTRPSEAHLPISSTSLRVGRGRHIPAVLNRSTKAGFASPKYPRRSSSYFPNPNPNPDLIEAMAWSKIHAEQSMPCPIPINSVVIMRELFLFSPRASMALPWLLKPDRGIASRRASVEEGDRQGAGEECRERV